MDGKYKKDQFFFEYLDQNFRPNKENQTQRDQYENVLILSYIKV